MHLNAKSNSYVEVLGELFDEIPKSVFAAIAVSGFTAGGDYLELAKRAIINEWRVLNENGIVPQKVPAKFLAAYPQPDEEPGIFS